MRIIGIDPGLARVGYGIIEVENENMNQIKIELKEKGIEYIVIGKTTDSEKITFKYKKGPRNKPAHDWLISINKDSKLKINEGINHIPHKLLLNYKIPKGIKIKK